MRERQRRRSEDITARGEKITSPNSTAAAWFLCGEARARRLGRHLGGVGRVVEEHLARDGPGALRMSCSRSGQGIDMGVAGDGTDRRTGVANLGASAGAWASDGRPGSAPESQIGEESGRQGTGWAGDSGSKEENGADFFENVLRELTFGESSRPCIRRGPQTRGDEMPEKTQPVWTRFC
jgi:hypothetical protein